MASLYDLSVEKVALDINDKIMSMTIKVLNAGSSVTDLGDTPFVIYTPKDFTTKIPYTLDSPNTDKPNGIYTITFTTPQTKEDPLMIYAQAADETKLSKTLYYDYAENAAAGGVSNIKFDLNNPGTYTFELNKVNDTVIGNTTATSVTLSHPASKNTSIIEIVDIDTDLVQIIPDGEFFKVPLKLTLKDSKDDPVSPGNYSISISDGPTTPAPSTPAKPSSKEEDPK